MKEPKHESPLAKLLEEGMKIQIDQAGKKLNAKLKALKKQKKAPKTKVKNRLEGII